MKDTRSHTSSDSPHSVAERVVVVGVGALLVLIVEKKPAAAAGGRVHAVAAINVGPANTTVNTTLNTTLKNAALDAAAVLNAVKQS